MSESYYAIEGIQLRTLNAGLFYFHYTLIQAICGVQCGMENGKYTFYDLGTLPRPPGFEAPVCGGPLIECLIQEIWEFRAPGRNPKRNKLGRMPA